MKRKSRVQQHPQLDREKALSRAFFLSVDPYGCVAVG